MIVPKIVYNSTTLNFTYPPVNKPGGHKRTRQGVDSFSTIGVKQSITWRVDKTLALGIETIPGSDVADWEAFIDWALLGGVFQYYPDATINSYDDFTLDSTDWSPERVFIGHYKFTIIIRKDVDFS